MTELEYQEHIQHTHNALCKIVIRHAAIDNGVTSEKTVGKENGELAAARSLLPEQAQEEIFQYEFQRRTQKEIGEKYGQT